MSPLPSRPDTNALYSGPVVDAHHHLWDLSKGCHPWLAPATGQTGLLARDQLPDDYLRAACGHNVVATVHIEAGWDPDDPHGEVAWLDALKRPAGLATRYVAFARLAAPDITETLGRHAAHKRIVGIREILSREPVTAHGNARSGEQMDDPVWRRGLAKLAPLGLSFDMLIRPWQLGAALRLARDFPDTSFILNHCGSPVDRSKEGMTEWKRGLGALAQAQNVGVKISDLVAYDPRWTLESLSEVVLHCLECFGPQRSMLASDHPVETMHASFDETYRAFKIILAKLTSAELHAIFCGNAARYYKISEIGDLETIHREKNN